MTGTSATTATSSLPESLLRHFEGPWRDDTPVFGCCRKAVSIAVTDTDVISLAALDPAARVSALRAAVEAELPGHLDTHRCCVGHIADLAFDLPELLAPAGG